MIVFPVIHFFNTSQAVENAKLASRCGADGVFLIDMTGRHEPQTRLAAEIIKNQFPNLKVGVNVLSARTLQAVHHAIVYNLDMVWSDEQLYFDGERPSNYIELKETVHGAKIQLFTAVSFKYQLEDPKPTESAYAAARDYFYPTTSGAGTGIAADVEKVKAMRESFMYSSWHKNPPIALASGLTPFNISLYKPYITHAIVSTGISKDFHNFDETLLKSFIENAK